MGMIEGIRVRNFRSLRDVAMGRLWDVPGSRALSPLTAVVGRNGVGKSALLDVFGFLADCLRHGVEKACDLDRRRGFDQIRSKGQDGPVSFEIGFRESPEARPITYELSLAPDQDGRPRVLKERLRQPAPHQDEGSPPPAFLILDEGRGIAWKGDAVGERLGDGDGDGDGPAPSAGPDARPGAPGKDAEPVELEDDRRLGIAVLGALKQHPRISALRRFIEGWYLCRFDPDSAREPAPAIPRRRPDPHGDDLGGVVQYLERENPEALALVLQRTAAGIPGLERIDTERTDDGRLLLRFHAQGFERPFFASQMSDGTLKLLAYLLLLASPDAIPLICIEEPENGLHHGLLETLAAEFRSRADSGRSPSQILLTTHQPCLLDGLRPEEVWILEKRTDGFSSIRCAADDPLVRNLVSEGIPLGSLWCSDFLDG